ncbi:ECF RNA polymerase sigma factor SigK [Nocardiopsis sp. CNT-189]|uniref:ECF RNA polymerase sigma factor SigK n=1 Tax=Nocardiopsis oceanisediminis TaxID=2816862 RepID=UPI003B2BD2EC
MRVDEAVPAHPPDGAGARELAGLLRRTALGDAAAFEGLYRELAGPVLGLASRVLRDRAQAEEVAQEVFVEVWRLAARYDPEAGGVRAWVLTVAHRRAVDRVRAEQAASDRELRAGRAEPRSTPADEVPDQVERGLDRERVRRCLGRLTELQREAVRLTYYRGYTQREAAAALRVPLTSVKGRLRDGLIRLRDCLGVAG